MACHNWLPNAGRSGYGCTVDYRCSMSVARMRINRRRKVPSVNEGPQCGAVRQ